MTRPYGIHADAVLRELYRQRDALERRRIVLEATIAELNTEDPEDWPEYDKAIMDHEEINGEIVDVLERIVELEE